jgi:hypothetical protein
MRKTRITNPVVEEIVQDAHELDIPFVDVDFPPCMRSLGCLSSCAAVPDLDSLVFLRPFPSSLSLPDTGSSAGVLPGGLFSA